MLTIMKGYHFFLEYPTPSARRKGTRKNLGAHSGTVLATYKPKLWIPGPGMVQECISSVQDFPGGPVCVGSCGEPYLRSLCLRISEATAREIHPLLFIYLES